MAENDVDTVPRRGRKQRKVVKEQPAVVEERIQITYQPAYPDEGLRNFIRGLLLGAIAGGVGAVLNARQSGALTRAEMERLIRDLRGLASARADEARTRIATVTNEARATVAEFTAEGRAIVADLSGEPPAEETPVMVIETTPPIEATVPVTIVAVEVEPDDTAADATRPIPTVTSDEPPPTGPLPPPRSTS